MKRIITILFAASSFLGMAQYDTDFGGRLGMAFYMGDIGGPGPAKTGPAAIQFSQTRLHMALHGRRFFHPMFAVRAELGYGQVRATDKAADEPTRYSRNLSFRNNIIEFSARGEFHPFSIKDVGRTYRYSLQFNAYGFLGIGVFYNNPQAEYNGTWTALQPLQTEGVSYSKIVPAIPLGAGFEFRINKHHIVGFEFGARMTFTDYIDDASTTYQNPSTFTDPTALALQDRSIELEGSGDPLFIGSEYYSYGTNPNANAPRGNPDNNDWYAFAGVNYSYALKNKRRSFKRKKYNFVRAKVKRRRSRAKF